MIWNPSSLGDAYCKKLEDILHSWNGTPYMVNNQCKGYGVDCVRFVCGVVDEMCGYQRTFFTSLPPDACFHNKKFVWSAMRTLRRFYRPMKRIPLDNLEPGDLIVSGPENGGPGHLMIVGPRKNTIWQTLNEPGVVYTGWTMPSGYKAFTALRIL